MTVMLTAEEFEHTKEKFRALEKRLADIEKRTDLHPEHLESVRRTYRETMRELLREINLYEAKHRSS